RCPVGAKVLVLVALFLPVLVSVKPLGALSVSVLTGLPVAFALSLHVALPILVLPEAIVTVSWMSPVPLLLLSLAPELAVLLQLALVKMPGNRSSTVAPVTVLGPLLLTTIV